MSSRSLTALQQIDEADLNALDAFLPSDATERKTLAEIILEKLQDAEETTEEQSVTQKVHFDSAAKSTRGLFELLILGKPLIRVRPLKVARSYHRAGPEGGRGVHQVSEPFETLAAL